MKKALLALVATLGLTFNMSAQNPGEDNGFGLKLHVAIPGSEYGNEGKTSNSLYTTEREYSGLLFGIDLDNRWYVWHNDMFGVAVNAHWMDFSFGAGEIETTAKSKASLGSLSVKSSSSVDVTNMEVGLLGVGPMFTFYLGHDMAVDGYYNIVPTAMCMFEENQKDDEDDYFFWGAGLTHNVGAAFRWKFLQTGLEYRLGNMDLEEDDEDIEYEASANSLRVFFGFKF